MVVCLFSYACTTRVSSPSLFRGREEPAHPISHFPDQVAPHCTDEGQDQFCTHTAALGGGAAHWHPCYQGQRGDFLPDPGLDTNHTQTPISRERSFIKQGREDLFFRRSTGKPMQALGHSPCWSIIFVIVFLVDESMIDDR